MAENKRNYKRFPTHLHATGQLPDGGSFACQIVDITPQGLAFLIDRDIEVNGQFELEIHIDEKKRIVFRCQTVRTEPATEENLKKICTRIIYGAAADQMRLYQFYSRLKKERKL